jgi:hypothetical protein
MGSQDELLEWPPDLLALTEAILTRSEAYRFALSPPQGTTWPPEQSPAWPDAVAVAGRDWCAWVQDRSRDLPELVEHEWDVLRQATDVALADLSAATRVANPPTCGRFERLPLTR